MNELLEISKQPYMIVWSILFAIFALCTLISLVAGLDFDIDMDADIDMDISGDVTPGGDFFRSLCLFVNIGHVPVTLIIFTLVGINWGLGVYLNDLINSGHSNLLGFGMGAGVFLLSIPMTKYLTMPFKAFFKSLTEETETMSHAIGSVCDLETEVNDKHGRAVVKTGTSPLGIMVMCEEGKTISKGSKAVVLEFDKKANRYLVAEVEDDIFNDIEKK